MIFRKFFAAIDPVLLFLTTLVVAAFAVGRYSTREDLRRASAEYDDLLRLAEKRRATEVADLEKRLQDTSHELHTERQGADRMFSWYERCLDGRTCTEAGPPLELWRGFEIPKMPNMSLGCGGQDYAHRDYVRCAKSLGDRALANGDFATPEAARAFWYETCAEHVDLVFGSAEWRLKEDGALAPKQHWAIKGEAP